MKKYGDMIFDGIACLGTAMQFEDIEMVFRIISLILTVCSIIASLVFKILMWKQKATKDGKIDAEEVKELRDIFDEEKDKLK